MLRLTTYGCLVVCVAIAIAAGCDRLTMPEGSAYPMPPGPGELFAPQVAAPAATQEAFQVLGHTLTGAPGFDVTLDIGATNILTAQNVQLLALPGAVPAAAGLPRDSALVAVTDDPQDGRVFYSVTENAGLGWGATQARISVKAVPAQDPTGIDEMINGFIINIRATRPGTASADVVARGDDPLFNVGVANGNIVLQVDNVQVNDNTGTAFGTVIPELAFITHDPALPATEMPMACFLRSGGLGAYGGGKFIHLAGAIANVPDNDQPRELGGAGTGNPHQGGIAFGTGVPGNPTAQVPGAFAQANALNYAFVDANLGAPLNNADFTFTILQLSYFGGAANVGDAYINPALAIAGNSIAPGGDVFELTLGIVLVTAP